MADSIRHYLDTHVDYRVGEEERIVDSVSIAYSYHHSGEHQLPEQRIYIPPQDLTEMERTLLLDIHRFLEIRIAPPTPVRLPHATVTPQIRFGVLTFVAQDHRQASILPVARLYYYEMVHETSSQIERQVRVEGPDWSAEQTPVAKRLREWVRKRAWGAYSAQVAKHLHHD
jgi:hypothetical protein